MALSEVVVVVQPLPVVVVVVPAAAVVTQQAKLVEMVALEGQVTSLERQGSMLPVVVVASTVTPERFREVFLVLVVPASVVMVEAKRPTALTEIVAQKTPLTTAVGVSQVLQTLDPVVVGHQTPDSVVTVAPVLSLFAMRWPAKALSASVQQLALLVQARLLPLAVAPAQALSPIQ
jgi:hypothetical protein